MSMTTIHVTARGIASLFEIAVIGYMDTPVIWRRHFPEDKSGQSCRRWLRQMTSCGFLTPVKSTIAYDLPRGGRVPTIYCITPLGVEVLTQRIGEAVPRPPSASPRPETLQHRLGISQLHVLLRDACLHCGFSMPQWIDEYAPDPEGPREPGAKLSQRFLLCQSYPQKDGKPVTCWPDATSLVYIPGATATSPPIPLVILWEYDRSTETLNQVKGKIPGYRFFLSRGDVRRLWPTVADPVVRVFFVTQSDERRQHVAEAIRDVDGSAAFRLATYSTLTPATFFLMPVWFDANGGAKTIRPAQ